MNNQMKAPTINEEEVVDIVLSRIHQEFPDVAISKFFVEMVLEFEKEYLEKEGVVLPIE